MTEAEWFTSNNPLEMFDFVTHRNETLGHLLRLFTRPKIARVSDRKCRLFACARWQRFREHVTVLKNNSPNDVTDKDAAFLAAVEISELYADGLVSGDELKSIRKRVYPYCEGRTWLQQFLDGMDDSWWNEPGDIEFSPWWLVARSARDAARHTILGEWGALPILCQLLREVLGNPFQPVSVDPGVLTPTVTTLAQSIYDDRSFDHLPILADALEEAGCENAAILDHCRQPSEHARGCWVVDALLGKK